MHIANTIAAVSIAIATFAGSPAAAQVTNEPATGGHAPPQVTRPTDHLCFIGQANWTDDGVGPQPRCPVA
jgi:hypothetical protein